MWTLSDLAPIKKVFITKNSKALGEILNSEDVVVEYVPSLQYDYNSEPYREEDWWDAPEATRDCGFFHGNKFYGIGYHPFIKNLGCDITQGFGGGNIVSDGKISLISGGVVFGSGPNQKSGERLLGYLEEELKMECRQVLQGRHIDFFINFVSPDLVVYNKGLVKALMEGKEGDGKSLENLDKTVGFLASKGYSILEVDRLKEYLTYDINENLSFFHRRNSRSNVGGILMTASFVNIANMLPIRGGVVVMIQDFKQHYCKEIGWQHIPTELRNRGLKVYEMPYDSKDYWSHDTGPRCRTLPIREI